MSDLQDEYYVTVRLDWHKHRRQVLHKPGLLTYRIQGDIPRPSRGTTIFIYEEGKVWLRETNSSLVWKKQLEGFCEKRA